MITVTYSQMFAAIVVSLVPHYLPAQAVSPASDVFQEESGVTDLAEQQPFDWVGVHAGSQGRLYVWRIGDEKYGVVMPYEIRVASRPGTDLPNIGLVHSGYSEDDPDGKTALVSVTLELARVTLSDVETQQFVEQGIQFDDAVTMVGADDPQAFAVDISLPSAPEEEARLRAVLQLPKRLSGSSIPLSFRWKDVPGEDILKWLTDDELGLRFVLKSAAVDGAGVGLEYRDSDQASLDIATLQEWWLRHSPRSTTFRWRGGADLVALSLAKSTAIRIDDFSPPMATITEEIRALKVALTQASTIEDGINSLDRNALFTLSPKFPKREQSFIANVQPAQAVSMGVMLNNNAALVRDLSSDTKGLEPFKVKLPEE